MEIAVGLLLNVLFWVVVVSVAVFLLSWLGAQLFPVTRQRWRVRKEISHPGSTEASSRASFTEEEETKKNRHRRAA